MHEVVLYARECLGTPFHHQGRVIGVGMDCPGPLIYALEKLGLEYNDFKGYPRTPYEGMMEKILRDQPHLKEVNKSDLQPGDVVLMKIIKDPQHLAIYTGNTMIHCYSTVGKVVEHRMDEAWKKKITHVFRVVE